MEGENEGFLLLAFASLALDVNVVRCELYRSDVESG